MSQSVEQDRDFCGTSAYEVDHRDRGQAFVEWLESSTEALDAALLASYAAPGTAVHAAEARGTTVRDTAHSDIDRYLYSPVRRYTANAGKRMRPRLCLLAAYAAGGDSAMRAALSAAAAIEHFQTAALIHDDVADHSTHRRGAPCLHSTEGEGIAITCGDLALTEVFGNVIHTDDLSVDVRLSVLEELFLMMQRTIEGQALDLGWARDNRWDLSEEDYYAMATLKTAYYSVTGPLVIGACIGGARDEDIHSLRTFGREIGLAFQIQDDLLNLLGDAKKLGKDALSDITEGKRTLMVVHALQALDEPGRAELIALLSKRATESRECLRAVDIMKSAGSLRYAASKVSDFVQTAKDQLAQVKFDEHARMILLSMADFFVHRCRHMVYDTCDGRVI